MDSPSTDSTAIVEAWDDSQTHVSPFDQNCDTKERLEAVEVQNGTPDSVNNDKKFPAAARLPSEVLEQ